MPIEAQPDQGPVTPSELQPLIDRFPEDSDALRDVCLLRLRKALERYEPKLSRMDTMVWRIRAFLEKDLSQKEWSPHTDDSWRSADLLMSGLYHAVFAERFLRDGADQLDESNNADRYRSTIDNQLVAEKLDCTPEQLERLIDCIAKGFSDEIAKRKNIP